MRAVNIEGAAHILNAQRYSCRVGGGGGEEGEQTKGDQQGCMCILEGSEGMLPKIYIWVLEAI